MRLGTAIVALFVMATSGCFRSAGGKAGVALAGVGAASGFVYGVSCADYTSSDHNCESTGATVLGFAILGAIIGGIVIAVVSEQHYRPPAIPEPGAMPPAPAATAPGASPDGDDDAMPAVYEPIQARDPMAHQLTIQAHRAAFRGQCAGLPAAASRVRALDAEYYARVFAADAAIARCQR